MDAHQQHFDEAPVQFRAQAESVSYWRFGGGGLGWPMRVDRGIEGICEALWWGIGGMIGF
jgi:hypothetical protein